MFKGSAFNVQRAMAGDADWTGPRLGVDGGKGISSFGRDWSEKESLENGCERRILLTSAEIDRFAIGWLGDLTEESPLQAVLGSR